MIEQIYQSLIEKHPEWNKTINKNSCLLDIKYILHFLKEDNGTFESFIIWQKELLQSINIEISELVKLLKVISNFDSDEIESSKLNKFIDNFSEELYPTIQNESKAKDIIDFHFNLFGQLDDPACNLDLKASASGDIEYILTFLKQTDSDNNQQNFELFVAWHKSLLKTLGIPKISLVRMLVSISVFSLGEEKNIIKNVIKKLINDELPSFNNLISSPEHIISFHFKIFEKLNDPSCNPELKQSAVNDVKFIIQFLKQAVSNHNKDNIERLIRWQLSLFTSIKLSKISLIRVLVTISMFRSEKEQAVLNSIIKKLVKNELTSLSGTSEDVVNFHYNLFENLDNDPACTPEFRPRAVNELSYLKDYLIKATSENDQDFYDLFIAWNLSMMECLDIPKNSLIRFLVSLSVFSSKEENKILHLTIERLINNNLTKSLERDNEPSIIATELHIKLFGSIDEHASEKFKPNMINDAVNHIQFLDQSVSAKSEILFIEYVNWVNSTLTSLGIDTYTSLRFFNTIKLVLQKYKNYEGIDILRQGINRLNSINKEKSVDNMSFLANEEAKDYLSYLVKGDRKNATKYITDLIDKGMPIKDIYINVFQSAQYEMGRLWELNKVSVAQEHFGTATTQMIMSMLYPQILSHNPNGKNVVTTCVGSELHEMGIRMVSDFLEMEGWNTYFTGANTPVPAILDAINENNADIVAISVTLTPHINKAVEIIKQIKKSNANVKILVGGYPFIKDPELYKNIGADGVAKSALNVHETAINLLN